MSLLALTLAGTSVANAQTKQLVYMIAEVEVTDAATYQKYLDANTPLVKAAGGRFLTRGETLVALDGPAPKRFAIIEFDSMEKVQAYRNSPEYKKIVPMRDKGSKYRSFIAGSQVSGTVGK